MPFYIRISRCHAGHELTVHAEPINDYEVHLTWACEECAAEGKAAGDAETPQQRGDEAVGGGGDEPGNLVRAAAPDPRQHHVYELVDGRDSTVFYVGVTLNPKTRYADHCSSGPAFPRIQESRSSCYMRIVASFDDRARAEAYEALLINQTPNILNKAIPPLRSVC